jgi:mannose-1-phosphate guanylyltransferase
MDDERMDGENTSVRGVVLAGGEGKRLRPLSYYFQKCMIPIGSKQKPLLEYIIHLLRSHGIIDVALLVGYKHEQIVNYFNGGARFGVEITYVPDDPALKGTGGSLLNAYRRGAITTHDSLLVYYGDIVSDINLTEMVERHRLRGAIATLALSEGYQVRTRDGTLEQDVRESGHHDTPDSPLNREGRGGPRLHDRRHLVRRGLNGTL